MCTRCHTPNFTILFISGQEVLLYRRRKTTKRFKNEYFIHHVCESDFSIYTHYIHSAKTNMHIEEFFMPLPVVVITKRRGRNFAELQPPILVPPALKSNRLCRMKMEKGIDGFLLHAPVKWILSSQLVAPSASKPPQTLSSFYVPIQLVQTS